MLLIFAGLAKANDYFNRPWLFAGIFAGMSLLIELLAPSSSSHHTFGAIFLNSAFKFVIAGATMTFLHRYQDSILAWIGILACGMFVLAGGARFFLWM
jgi:hypothetical protein